MSDITMDALRIRERERELDAMLRSARRSAAQGESRMGDISLDALRLRERELELDAVLVRGRIEEVRRLILLAERRRGGRPRKPTAAGLTVINEPETDEQLVHEEAAG